MKRIVSMLIAVLMIANSALAYTTTVRAKGLGIVVTSGVGNTITVTPKTEEIKGWLVEEGDIEIVDNQFTMPEGNVKIKAIESKYLLTIEFPYFTNKEERAVGESITVQALTENEEYTFKNWTATGLTLTSEQQTNATLTFTMPANEVIIVANYEVIPTATTYTVTYDANGGIGTMNNQTFAEGIAQNLTTNNFTREGYTFAGWSTTAGGSVEYIDGASYTATGNTTLYAVWTTDSYTIIYNLDGGNVTGNPTTYSVTTETITLNNPTKEGFAFSGWTGSNGTIPSTTVTIAKGSTGNKTYTANWIANKYTVTFNPNDGTETTITQTYTHGVAQNLTANTFTREGYNFLGWSTTVQGNKEYSDGTSYIATADITLYAVWQTYTWNKYEVSYSAKEITQIPINSYANAYISNLYFSTWGTSGETYYGASGITIKDGSFYGTKTFTNISLSQLETIPYYYLISYYRYENMGDCEYVQLYGSTSQTAPYLFKSTEYRHYNDYAELDGVLYEVGDMIKGSFIETVNSATYGVYPDNGVHTDGYWYVKVN